MSIKDYPLTVDDISKALGKHRVYIAKLCRKGMLDSAKFGRYWRFTNQAVPDYVERCTREAVRGVQPPTRTPTEANRAANAAAAVFGVVPGDGK